LEFLLRKYKETKHPSIPVKIERLREQILSKKRHI